MGHERSTLSVSEVRSGNTPWYLWDFGGSPEVVGHLDVKVGYRGRRGSSSFRLECEWFSLWTLVEVELNDGLTEEVKGGGTEMDRLGMCREFRD